jgi:hypothetical protein
VKRGLPVLCALFGVTLAGFSAAACSGDDELTWLDDGPTPGCRDGDRAEQRYGTACLCCHRGEFSVAGSIDHAGPPVARVVVTDAEGRTVVSTPNSFDNFFGHLRLTPPLSAAVYGPAGDALRMRDLAPDGDCNRCHSAAGPEPPLHGP